MNPYIMAVAPIAAPIAMAGLIALWLIWFDDGGFL